MQFQETTKFYEKIVKMNKLSRKISKKLFIQFSFNAFLSHIYFIQFMFFPHFMFKITAFSFEIHLIFILFIPTFFSYCLICVCESKKCKKPTYS